MATSREALIGDGHQMALDRTAQYTTGQGVNLGYSSDDLGVDLQVVNNLGGGGDVAANDSAYTYLMRVEYLASGSWSQFDQYTSGSGGAAGTLIGFSYWANDGGNNELANDEQTTWNVDVQWQWGGSGLYLSYTDFSDDATTGATDTDTNITQLMYSYDMGDNWEVYARWSDDELDNGSVTDIGVNNYLAGQNAKWTTQISMDDRDADDDVTTISTQLQFMF